MIAKRVPFGTLFTVMRVVRVPQRALSLEMGVKRDAAEESFQVKKGFAGDPFHRARPGAVRATAVPLNAHF